jgi:cysteine desulfurase
MVTSEFGPPLFKLPPQFCSQQEGAPVSTGASSVVFGGVTLPPSFIALDYAASTPLRSDVFAAMEPWLFAYFGNPAARIHPLGEVAELAVQEARATVARLIGVSPAEIVFTASATESNNLALRGLVASPFRSRTKILYGATEHASVATTAQELMRLYGPSHGIVAEPIPVDERGQVRWSALETLIDEKTLLVSLMDVNNETGIVQERLADVIALAHARGAYVHVDAVQGFARGPFATRSCDWDMLTVASGKIYGPRGAALLAVRRRSPRLRLEPQLTGGGHEGGLRSSTLNVAAIVGFARAMELLDSERIRQSAHLSHLEGAFLDELRRSSAAVVIGEDAPRIPGIVMLNFPACNAMKLVENARCLAVGVGSACRTLHATASHVLLAMGLPLDEALGSLRVSFGLPNTEAEVREAAALMARLA